MTNSPSKDAEATMYPSLFEELLEATSLAMFWESM